MKALVIGSKGSIGSRHMNNLKSLGVQVIGCDLNDKPDYLVDFAVIATPTENHFSQIKTLVSKNIPFFCEKPIAGSSFELNLISEMNITAPTMVGCNLRFSNSMGLIKSFAQQSEIISFHARISDGNPLRMKYKEGIALQDIHEFDYISHVLGSILEVNIVSNPDKSIYDAFVLLESGVQGTIHGDSISKGYFREVILTSVNKTLTIPIDVSPDMYMTEMSYFVDCLKNGRKPMNSIKEAISLTRMLCEEYEFA